MNESVFENAIANFEREFANGHAPLIERYVDTTDVNSQELFAELLHTELELKIRDGQSARVEAYAERFPQIRTQSKLYQELIYTEFRIRQLYEPGLSLEEYQKRFPDEFPGLVSQFSAQISTSPGAGATIAEAPHKPLTFSDSNSRFRKLRLHQQGGLGNVWKAIDSELNRVVAIKEIKSKYAMSTTHRARFAREIIVSSRLQHPGIVSIYGLGYLTDGTPYFAMQYVNGSTLESAILSLDKDTPHHLRIRDSVNFRRLLQHFLDICNTVHYAHTQGVIHRDLKPANVMIGEFGETFVVDWGLAKLTQESGTQEDKRQNEPTSYQFMVQESLNGGSIDGAMIGSPGFMSPEQISGAIEYIGVESDVYSLGAILLSLISSGQQPDTRSNSFEKSAATFKLDLIKPELRPLASICAKAMSAAPANRYPSAKELGEDVERFVLDEHVTAHSESTVEAISRFSRRNRSFINATLAALAVVSLTATTAAVWINSARSDAIAAKFAESEQRKKVEIALASEQSRTRQLTETVGVFADLFAGSDDSELACNLNQVTLQQAIDQIKDRVNEYEDPIVRAFLHAVIARNNKAKGSYNISVDNFKQSLDLLEQQNIKDSDPLYVDVLNGLCSVEAASGNFDRALEIADQILQLCQEHPSELQEAKFKILLVEIPVLLRFQKQNEAKSKMETALAIADKIYSGDKTSNNYLWGQYTHATILRLSGETEPALQKLKHVIAVHQEKDIVHPLSISSRAQIAELLFTDDKKQAAENMVAQALTDAQSLMGVNHPDTMKLQSFLGTMLAMQDDDEKRLRGIELLESTRNWQLKAFANQSYSAIGTTCMLSKVYLEQGSPDSLRNVVNISQEVLQKIEADMKGKQRPVQLMYSLHTLMASAYEKLGNNSAAAATLEHAIQYSILLNGESSVATTKLRERKNKLSD